MNLKNFEKILIKLFPDVSRKSRPPVRVLCGIFVFNDLTNLLNSVSNMPVCSYVPLPPIIFDDPSTHTARYMYC